MAGCSFQCHCSDRQGRILFLLFSLNIFLERPQLLHVTKVRFGDLKLLSPLYASPLNLATSIQVPCYLNTFLIVQECTLTHKNLTDLLKILLPAVSKQWVKTARFNKFQFLQFQFFLLLQMWSRFFSSLVPSLHLSPWLTPLPLLKTETKYAGPR